MLVPARDVVRGELVNHGALALRAAEVARQRAALLTRSTYAGAYRAFCVFLGPDAHPDAVAWEACASTDVADTRLQAGIDAAAQRRHGLGRVT